MTKARALLASALALGMLGCSAQPAGEPNGSRVEAIIGGEASGREQDGVVLLRAVLDNGEILCSASLVAPNLIMTARHCVSYVTDGQFACSVRGEVIDNPTGGGRVGLHLPATSLEVYAGKAPRKSPLARGQRILSTLSPTLCENDLAFVVLDTALDLPVVAMRLGRPAELHEAVTLVGYGLSENEQDIDYRTQPRLQKRGLEVTGVGPDSIDDGVTTVPPRVLFVDGPAGCTGDSGGPLLAESSGAVIGVYSLLRGGSCLAPAVRSSLVHVPPFQSLIDEAFAASGAEPLLEPLPAAGGADGAGEGGTDMADNAGGDVNADPITPTGGVGGAAGEAVAEPDAAAAAAKSSSCTVGAAQQDDVGVARLLAVAALGVLGRRRRNVARRRAERRR